MMMSTERDDLIERATAALTEAKDADKARYGCWTSMAGYPCRAMLEEVVRYLKATQEEGRQAQAAVETLRAYIDRVERERDAARQDAKREAGNCDSWYREFRRLSQEKCERDETRVEVAAERLRVEMHRYGASSEGRKEVSPHLKAVLDRVRDFSVALVEAEGRLTVEDLQAAVSEKIKVLRGALHTWENGEIPMCIAGKVLCKAARAVLTGLDEAAPEDKPENLAPW